MTRDRDRVPCGIRLAHAACALATTIATVAHAGKVDWLQFGFDATHSGNNIQETAFNAHGTGVHGLASMYALYHAALPAGANSSPVLLTDVPTASGMRDVIFIVTLDGRILARDAADGSALWERQPVVPPFTSLYGTGIASTPAVDPNRQFVYAWAFDGRVHKWSVGDGSEIIAGGWPQVVTLKPEWEKASSALAIGTTPAGRTYLYATTSGFYGDGGSYQGHLVAIDLASGSQTVFNALCSDQPIHFSVDADCETPRAGIWGRGGATYDARIDRVFVSTGNGRFDADTGGHDFGDSVLSLSADGRGANGLPIDSYTPAEFQDLEWRDADLGSITLAILPSVPGSTIAYLGVQGGKDAKLRLLNLDDMSGQGGPARTGGELQKVLTNLSESSMTANHPTVWTRADDQSVWFTAGGGAYRLEVDAAGMPSIVQQWTGYCRTSMVIVNDVLFCASDGLGALDAATGQVLWHDYMYGGDVHWQSPIVANGRLYVMQGTAAQAMLSAYTLGQDALFADGFDGG